MTSGTATGFGAPWPASWKVHPRSSGTGRGGADARADAGTTSTAMAVAESRGRRTTERIIGVSGGGCKPLEPLGEAVHAPLAGGGGAAHEVGRPVGGKLDRHPHEGRDLLVLTQLLGLLAQGLLHARALLDGVGDRSLER